jgi:hypothetical protein
MNENQHIDQFFKQKLAQKEYAFNPTSWEKAQALIEQQEKRKRRILWWRFSGAAAILVLVASLFLKVNSDVEKQKSTLNNIKNTSHQNNEKQLQINNAKTTPVEEVKKEEVSQLTESIVEVENIKTEIKDNQIKTKEPSQVPLSQEITLVQETNNQKEENKEYMGENANWEDLQYMSIINTAQLDLSDYLFEKNPLLLTIDKLNFIRKINIHLIGGFSVSQGFLNNDLSRANPSLGYLGGIGTSIVLNSLVSFDVNLLYSQRGGLSQEPLPLEFSELGTTEIAKKFHQMDIPLFINYRFKNRHALCIGLQYNKMLGVKSEVYDVALDTKNTVIKNQPYFAKDDMTAIIGYKFLVNEKFNFGARANFGLFDNTVGQQAGDNTFDMNRQIRFILEYKILKY